MDKSGTFLLWYDIHSVLRLTFPPVQPKIPAMSGYPVEDIAEKSEENQTAKAVYPVLYDGQCEICQGCVSWLRALDRENKTICLPISVEVLSAVDSRLQIDQCLRQLHVVTSEGEILVGWDAVASIPYCAGRRRCRSWWRR